MKDLNKELLKNIKKNYSSQGPTLANTESSTELVAYDNELKEKWSEKYKKSIDCNNPKGFSQRAHCQGKKKKETKEATGSGSAGGYVMPLFGKIETKEHEDWTKKAQTNIDDVFSNLPKLKDLKPYGLKYSVKSLKNLLLKNTRPDGTFGDNKWKREEMPFPPELDILNAIFQSGLAKYYFIQEAKKKNKHHYDFANLITKESLDNFPIPESIFVSVAQTLTNGDDESTKKVETKEATSSSSSGQYSGPAFGAKSMSPKHWRGASKTQIPGGSFVQVKKKCKTFPYCNQGDINALKITKSPTIRKKAKKLSEQYGVDESVILKLIVDDIRKNYKF